MSIEAAAPPSPGLRWPQGGPLPTLFSALYLSIAVKSNAARDGYQKLIGRKRAAERILFGINEGCLRPSLLPR